ncbi:MAG: Crp/Fnr family transcriptional regulator [Syntrophobacterales bacterium]|nr:Crp/Fnr family transcriptional regulator [Syntrophobacterales bacterium]
MTNREMLLRQVPLFRSLRAEDTGRLAALLQRQTLSRGEFLCRKGEEGNALYMIIAGKIKIVRHSINGDEVILAVLSAGDFCGEMALLDGLPRSADAVAVEETYLYTLTRADFFSCVANNERAVRTILSTLSKRLRKADDFLEDIFFLNVSSRLVKKLLEIVGNNGFQEAEGGVIRLNITQTTIAGMIGASRESVNKELRNLREQGLIEIAEKKITILDFDKLRNKLL